MATASVVGREGQVVEMMQKSDQLNREFGVRRLTFGEAQGWLLNMEACLIMEDDVETPVSTLDMYFVDASGAYFCCYFPYRPYFYVDVENHALREIEALLRRQHEGILESIEIVAKEDLEMPNHLSGFKKSFMKLQFYNTQGLAKVRKALESCVKKNKANREKYRHFELNASENVSVSNNVLDCLNHVLDIREYDVAYVQRVCIDNGFYAGTWFNVSFVDGNLKILKDERLEPPPLRVLAYDIETTKAPLMFPNSEIDSIMMISYMVDQEGFLIVNREIVAEDIENFEYSPNSKFPGIFTVMNVANEEMLLKKFFSHIKDVKPAVFVTYNGDFFDWPFVDRRAKEYGLNLRHETGIFKVDEEYKGKFSVHLDAFFWVQRDSYLPQGSQGLKAVTKAKLNYDPVELDPEDMLPLASQNPQLLASYSVSDAVATYYLYMEYVHSFIFSLCTIIPMAPGDVLRKGSGTLCEQLLMVKAYESNIVCPNKKTESFPQFRENQLLESETYVGGHVECLESGIFRKDIKCRFHLNVPSLESLISGLSQTLEFVITKELGSKIEDVSNLEEVHASIKSKLEYLQNNPNLECYPLIYHLDVGAMYPNIILTNRLQPMAIVDEFTCASCDFNVRSSECQRPMEWTWRGKLFPVSRSEYLSIKGQMDMENLGSKNQDQSSKPKKFSQFDRDAEAPIIKRVKEYSQKIYKKIHVEKQEQRINTVCQRENSFYVDTVRSFRDRRYEFKAFKKQWSDKLKLASTSAEKQKAELFIQLYDSQQLAHKCILNSFYGYVMRKGARWHSMEMAGIVTQTGANIIKDARKFVESVGRVLELDTDGIWCILPELFPESFEICFHGKKSKTISYPCVILNQMVHVNYTNPQYLVLKDPATRCYEANSENSIFFEVDGPYRAMILPAAQEEGKSLKKRYAVFEHDGHISELKGFEIKRRGELKLIKIFQSQVFPAFLEGHDLESCYDAVARIANQWLDVLYKEGADVDDEELFELLSESKIMSKTLAEYGSAKSLATTAAKRMAMFLGESMVKNKGLCVKFIVSRWPENESVSARAIPTVIFSAEPAIMISFLKKWTGASFLLNMDPTEFDVRSILDWSYYIGRLGSAIQKIITMPAAFQSIPNPVPRVEHPDWLQGKISAKESRIKQSSLSKFFETATSSSQVSGGETSKSKNSIKNMFAKGSSSHFSSVEETSEHNTSEPQSRSAALDDFLKGPVVNKQTFEIIDPSEDFARWHKSQKKFWASINKKRRRLADSNTENLINKRSSSYSAKISSAQSSQIIRGRSQNIWHILQIARNQSTKNSFYLWIAMENGQMKRLSLSIPKIFFVNRVQTEKSSEKNSVKTLPRGRTFMHFEEVKLDVRGMSQAEQLAIFQEYLQMPDVEGVYETRVPLLFNALLKSGCICRTSGSSKDDSDLSIDDLDIIVSTSQRPYLHEITVHRIYLFHSSSSGALSRDGRAVFGLFSSGSLNSYDVNVVVVNPSKTRIDLPNIQAIVEQYSAAIEDENIAAVKLNVDWKTVAHAKEAVRLIQNIVFRKKVLSGSIASVVLAQMDLDESVIHSELPIVAESFPIVKVPWHSEDSRFPSLGWLQEVSRTMVIRFLQSDSWWSSAVATANYAQIPAGNLETDVPLFASDVLFARLLRQSNHILWASDSGFPDLGGIEEGEDFFEKDIENPEVLFSKLYRSPCLEISIDNLCANAMLFGGTIQTMEGVEQAESVEAGSYVQGDVSGVQSAFKVLRAFVANLFSDIAQNQNEVADQILQHFYRWLRSRSAKLYDPMLHKMVHQLMTKVFLRLCSEFKRHGAELVYGNFNKIIITTSKPYLENAISSAKFLVQSIFSSDVFSCISIEYERLWEMLIYLDSYNFQGIEYQGSHDVQEEGQVSDPTSRMSAIWNISSYLPSDARDYFLGVISEFLVSLYRSQLEVLESTSEVHLDAETISDQVSEKMKTYLSANASSKLFSIVDWISKELSGDERRPNGISTIFPKLPGSYLSFHSPALEFVKMVMHVMKLDSGTAEEIDVLRNGLLKFLGYGSFSPEAQFRNPCSTIILPDITCEFCNHSRDLDLARDDEILKGNWKCTICDHDYNVAAIEIELVRGVLKTSAVYQCQDLICKRCKTVKMDNMSDFCSCSGTYLCSENAEHFRLRLRVMKSMAEHYRFEWLQEVISMHEF